MRLLLKFLKFLRPKNLLMLFLLSKLAKKVFPINEIPWGKMADAGRKGIGNAFDKIKDFFGNIFKKGQTGENAPAENAINPEILIPIAAVAPVAGSTALLAKQSENLKVESPVYKVPREILGVPLDNSQQAQLKNGKSLVLDSMTGDEGQKFSGYAKINAQKGKLEIFNENPDKPGQTVRQPERKQLSQKNEKTQKSANKLKVS